MLPPVTTTATGPRAAAAHAARRAPRRRPPRRTPPPPPGRRRRAPRSRPRSPASLTVDDLVDEVAVVERDVADPAGEAVGERRARRGTRGAAWPRRSDSRSEGEASGCTATMRTPGASALTAVRDAGDQPAAADGHDDRADVRALLEELEADRALAGGGARVVEGVDEDGAGLALERLRRLDGVVVGRRRLRGPRPGSAAACSTFARGAVRGTKSVVAQRAAQGLRREGDAERVVAGRRRHDAAPPLVLRQARRGGTAPRAP